jgi:hypothetical protein
MGASVLIYCDIANNIQKRLCTLCRKTALKIELLTKVSIFVLNFWSLKLFSRAGINKGVVAQLASAQV